MKFYSHWQQPDPEDARTALVFGFMRHAPVRLALEPWLGNVLGRSVQVQPLAAANFWPRFRSVFDHQEWTEPELVFAAHDGAPLAVVVEAKPGFGQHTIEQVAREVVDTISASKGEYKRLALIMVGADLGEPPPVDGWRLLLRHQLAERGLSDCQVELWYSSWAQLGSTIRSCAAADPAWSAYADDVLMQLRLRELLGYTGAPMFDDLQGMTIPNVTQAFNRVVLAARQLFLALRSESRFVKLGLEPIGGPTLTILRDDGSGVLTAYEDWFQVSNLMIAARHPTWPERAGVYAAVWLPGDDEAELQAGAFYAHDSLKELSYAYGESEDVAPTELQSAQLRNADAVTLPRTAVGRQKEWRYAALPWRPGTAEADVAWAISALASAAAAWAGTG